LRKKKYASKIKSAQETQQTQENYAIKKQKYASASRATDAIGHCVRKRNDRTDSIFPRNERKRQPIGMLDRSSGNHDWLLEAANHDCQHKRLRYLRFSFTQRTYRTQRKCMRCVRLNGNRALGLFVFFKL